MKKEKPPISRWLETDGDGICLILKHFSRCLVLLFTIQVVALDKQKWSEVIERPKSWIRFLRSNAETDRRFPPSLNYFTKERNSCQQ
jgi:hypothetical protein